MPVSGQHRCTPLSGVVGARLKRPLPAARCTTLPPSTATTTAFFSLDANQAALRQARHAAGVAPLLRGQAAGAMPQLGADPGGRRARDADFGAPQQIVGLWPQARVLAWVADAVARWPGGPVARWPAMPVTPIALPAEPAPGAALLAPGGMPDSPVPTSTACR